MARRLGLTMRVTAADGYKETRDALAQDWCAFLTAALPDVVWLPVPNLGRDVVKYVQAWGLDGFILTGGNDVGENVRRDETELALLDFAVSAQLPVFGVCRGLQMVQTFFGGRIRPCTQEQHVAVHHDVRIIDDPAGLGLLSGPQQVNSFHTQAVAVADLALPLRAFAVTEDGWAEGIYHPQAPILAVQWHPERYRPPLERDRQLLRYALTLGTV